MRISILGLLFSTLLFCSSHLTCAQEDAIQKKLELQQQKNNLIDWIYLRLDYVAEEPQQRLPYLMETQNKAWRKAKTADEHYAWLNLLSTQGYYQLLDGNILGSTNSYEAAYNYYLKNKVADFEIVEYTTKPLSNNYTRLGDYERALYLQKLAVKFLTQTKDKPENIAAVYSNIAISYRSMDNLSEAEKSIAAGLKLTDKNSETNIILNNILADILFDKKDYLAAAKLIETNISQQKNINQESAYWLMGSYTTAGKIYKELRNFKRAETSFTQALSLLNKYYNGSRLREKANVLTQLGTIKSLQQQPKLAIAYYQQTLSTLKITSANNKIIASKIYGDNMMVDVFKELGEAHLQLKQPTEAYQYIKFALLSANKIRNEFADDKTKERLQSNLKTIAEKGISICYGLYQKTKDKALLKEILNLAEQTKSRTLLDRINSNQVLAKTNEKDSLFIKKQNYERAIIYNEKQEIEGKSNANSASTAKLKYFLALVNKQIRQQYKHFNTDSYDVPIDKVLSALPNGKIIEYFFGQDAVYAIEIENKNVINVIRLGNAIEIKSAIQSYVSTYFQHGPNEMINNPKAFFLSSNHIYQSILKGITLTKNQSVIIIPDEILGYISFDGLVTNNHFTPNIANWPFLIKVNTITYAFSLKTLVASKAEVNNEDFAGLFITHQKNNNKPLKAIETEADGIKKMISGSFYYNEEVNIKKFNEVFEANKIVHIGTHAYLSGKNQEPTLDLDKEKIFLFELIYKKTAPSLVVLSACKTADGLLADGEGIISLSRGFNAIGTPATIAGLWNVNDVTASAITTSFYKYLLANQLSGKALHNAKLDWLNSQQNTNVSYLPYYWDSLIYMGVDQTISLSPATNWLLILTITGGLIALVIGFWLFKKK